MVSFFFIDLVKLVASGVSGGAPCDIEKRDLSQVTIYCNKKKQTTMSSNCINVIDIVIRTCSSS